MYLYSKPYTLDIKIQQLNENKTVWFTGCKFRCTFRWSIMIDHSQPSHDFNSRPLRLIMSSSDLMQSENGLLDTPDNTDVSNEIQISGVANFSGRGL